MIRMASAVASQASMKVTGTTASPLSPSAAASRASPTSSGGAALVRSLAVSWPHGSSASLVIIRNGIVGHREGSSLRGGLKSADVTTASSGTCVGFCGGDRRTLDHHAIAFDIVQQFLSLTQKLHSRGKRSHCLN